MAELLEETGIVLGDAEAREILFYIGDTEKFDSVVGQVFLLEYSAWPPFSKNRPNFRKIRKYQKELKAKINTGQMVAPKRGIDVEFGPPILARRYFGIWWFKGWARLTPLAGYALLAQI